ncbi:SDR family oxidoreductase [Acidobacteria bacterium AH-259-O06]|nr:SDR family oxidoreductase [Acidobacteria bacterium AH-259-O06]
MRVLILGGAGLLGHKLYQLLQSRFSVFATVRKPASYYHRFGIFDPAKVLREVDVRHTEDLLKVITWSRPDAVVNAVGVTKQCREAQDSLQSLEINSLLPHRLALICRARGCRLIHVSTDCVFSGQNGKYNEQSVSDAQDLYGRTKYLGEVCGEGALTLRTSFIGKELDSKHGLLEWFLSQKGKSCRGFSKAVFSGLTTVALSELVGDLIERHRELYGLYHVGGDPISKYDLLCLINEIYDLGVRIEKDEEFACDRSLDSSRFRKVTGWQPASWETMLVQMKKDGAMYEG